MAHCTAQKKPKRLKQPYFSATATRNTSKHFLFLPVKRGQGWIGTQGKRHSLWRPELGTCIASTAHTLTLRAGCALHSLHIPFISVLTCAEQRR